jgi:hypothetical protein
MTIQKVTATISETFNKETTMILQPETQPKPSLTLAVYDLTRKKLPELAKKYDGNKLNKEWTVEFGKKYAKITDNYDAAGHRMKSVWGFVVLKECTVGGIDYKPGDLLKAASFKAPAKHARGNIMDGTADYDIWGPTYLPNRRSSW